MNYYEELASSSLTFSGIWASNQTTNLHFVRVGSQVTMMMEGIQATSNSTQNHFTSTSAIPARFRPAINLNLPCVVINNNTDVMGGMLSVSTSGTITVYIITGGNFTSGQVDGVEAQSFTWTTI